MFNAEMTLVGSWKHKPVPKASCLILAVGEGQGEERSREEVRQEGESSSECKRPCRDIGSACVLCEEPEPWEGLSSFPLT